MLCYFKLLLGDILLYVINRLLLKDYMTYKADLFYYTQVPLCYIKSLVSPKFKNSLFLVF